MVKYAKTGRPKLAEPKRMVAFAVAPKLVRLLNALADRRGMSRSMLISVIVADYVEKHG